MRGVQEASQRSSAEVVADLAALNLDIVLTNKVAPVDTPVTYTSRR